MYFEAVRTGPDVTAQTRGSATLNCENVGPGGLVVVGALVALNRTQLDNYWISALRCGCHLIGTLKAYHCVNKTMDGAGDTVFFFTGLSFKSICLESKDYKAFTILSIIILFYNNFIKMFYHFHMNKKSYILRIIVIFEQLRWKTYCISHFPSTILIVFFFRLLKKSWIILWTAFKYHQVLRSPHKSISN